MSAIFPFEGHEVRVSGDESVILVLFIGNVIKDEERVHMIAQGLVVVIARSWISERDKKLKIRVNEDIPHMPAEEVVTVDPCGGFMPSEFVMRVYGTFKGD